MRRALLFTPPALLAVVFALEPLTIVLRGGSDLPAWSHWWCSPATLRAAVHGARGSGLGGLGATALTALELHWPHFLPILLGLATLVYLRRTSRG
jgi:hypothetical protein